MQLKDRNKQIPNGITFYIPELKWKAPGPYASFTRVCDAVEQVVKANPYLAQQHQWPQDRTGIENWVDAYNSQVCAQMGWTDYISHAYSGSSPKSDPRYQQETLQSLQSAAARAKELVAGAITLGEWEDSGEPAVDRDRATARALTCSTCPKNEPGDWTQWFTVPAAELIQRRVAKAQARDLSTIHDEKIQFCGACHCPLKLKVHVPIQWITKRLSLEVANRLREAPNCWVISESP